MAILSTQAIRPAGLYYMYQSAERLSLVLAVAALVLLMTGWRYLWKLAGVLLFLCLMLPWPNRVQQTLAVPLQQWATGSAVFCLELAGWDVLRDGNVIHIGDTSVAVAEACNGLRMITAFFRDQRIGRAVDAPGMVGQGGHSDLQPADRPAVQYAETCGDKRGFHDDRGRGTGDRGFTITADTP